VPASVLSKVVERKPRRKKVGLPQCDARGGFPEVVKPPLIVRDDEPDQVIFTPASEFGDQAPPPKTADNKTAPPPSTNDVPQPKSAAPARGDEAMMADVSEENARRVAAMAPEEVARELASVKELLGEDALEALRKRRASTATTPRTAVELEAALPASEKSKMAWTLQDESSEQAATKAIESAAAIATSPASSTPSARRYAISL